MEYKYRKLSPKERAEILRQRRERGYPLHSPPHLFREEGFFLITAAIYEHVPILVDPERCTDFENRLLEAFHGIQSVITGWVVLPTHYHILAGVESLDMVSAAIKLLHGTTSRMWNQEDGLSGRRKVWYKFFDRKIRDEKHRMQALNYIHFNPVKHGYTESPYQWPWSSLHQYYDTFGQDWLRQTWSNFHPGDFGKGWDEM